MNRGITLPLTSFNQIQLLINKNTLSVYKMIYYTYFTHALFQGLQEKKLLYLEVFKPQKYFIYSQTQMIIINST